MELKKAIFLDRDETVIRAYDGRPANTVDEVFLLPGAAVGLRMLKDLGFLLIVVTNQGGVGLGYMTLDVLKAQTARVDDLLIQEGAYPIDATYWCVHKVLDGCDCRKPKPGMITRACADLGIDPLQSYMVGDSPTDLEAGKAAGIPERSHAIIISDRFWRGSYAQAFTNLAEVAYAVRSA